MILSVIGDRALEINKVAERRAARIDQILRAAWTLGRQRGIAGLSLHELAREVGIRQPSLYEYFDSKNALYDAMFADGNRELLERLDAVRLPADPRAALKKMLATYIDFALEDPARCELLFQRHLPDFTPSAESYSLAQNALGRVIAVMRRVGVTAQADIDCIVAISAGLMDAQLANDPGGSRWIRHLGRMIDMYLDNVQRKRQR